MAWRPTQYLIEGELDNTIPGRVTGWMKFWGKEETVKFNLKGNFHRDIRGAKIRLHNDDYEEVDLLEAQEYLEGLVPVQTGVVGDITAGLPPQDYVSYCYVEWYGDENGRVVVELETDQVEVIGRPIPFIESDPISRDEQDRNMFEFLAGLTTPPDDEKSNS